MNRVVLVGWDAEDLEVSGVRDPTVRPISDNDQVVCVFLQGVAHKLGTVGKDGKFPVLDVRLHPLSNVHHLLSLEKCICAYKFVALPLSPFSPIYLSNTI